MPVFVSISSPTKLLQAMLFSVVCRIAMLNVAKTRTMRTNYECLYVLGGGGGGDCRKRSGTEALLLVSVCDGTYAFILFQR